MKDLSKLIEEEKQCWKDMEALYKSGDIPGFWKTYNKYLQERPGYSSWRALMCSVVKDTVEKYFGG